MGGGRLVAGQDQGHGGQTQGAPLPGRRAAGPDGQVGLQHQFGHVLGVDMQGHARILGGQVPQGRQAGRAAAQDEVQPGLAGQGAQQLGHAAGDAADIGQAQRHQDPLHRPALGPPGQGRLAQGRKRRPNRGVGGAQQQARAGSKAVGIVLDLTGRAGVQDQVDGQRPVGQIVQGQAGSALGQGAVVVGG